MDVEATLTRTIPPDVHQEFEKMTEALPEVIRAQFQHTALLLPG
jgi:hypothetical protein